MEEKSDTIQPTTKLSEIMGVDSVPPSSDESEHHPIDPVVDDPMHVDLGWRSWLVVFVTCFAYAVPGHPSVLMFAICLGMLLAFESPLVFVVVAAGSVIGFIIPSFLKDASIAGWIIQGPLLMQAVLSPIIGRLSDVVDRKWLSSIPPLIAFAGAVISAKAQSMSTLIAGGILIGVTLSTIGIIQAIPAEVLPMKFRPLANGFAFVAGSLGGLIGVLGAGALTNAKNEGWRSIFWMQAAFHLASSVGLIAFYHPKRTLDRPKMSIGSIIWACDPVGSILFMSSATLMLLALDWAGGTYAWSDPHVAAPLGIGLGLIVAFCLYEWKGRSDGLVAHVFFKNSPNFALSVFAFAVEGWIFYSAVNSVTPLIVRNLGFQTNSWKISIRQLSSNLANLFSSIPITWYATKYKDMKMPLLVTFTLFLIASVCYATITPKMSHAQIGYNVISAMGQAGPLTLLVALVQFTAPHKYLSTATGLAFSARAIGGAFGSAVLDVIINNKLASTYALKVGTAAVEAGLPSSSVGLLLAALAAGNTTALAELPGTNANVVPAALDASHWAYAKAYNLAWASIIPFIVLAIVSVACLKGVKELMTERVDATVENVMVIDEKGA